MPELALKSAGELARLIADRCVSSLELTEYFVARIEKFADLNAVVVTDFERALAAARVADAALARGQLLGPLHGLPMTIKESYNISGLKTTWGFPMWSDFVAREDAAVVSAYKAAGAHFLGKTNVPLMLSDYQSYNEIYGQTNNPWDLARSPGGSSGGSAAAMAAGLSALDSGSDIGGSIRNPAHYCGVYGHKPTHGIVPITGHQPPAVEVSNGVDLAVVGPLARSAEDLALAMDVVAGPMALQKPGWQLRLPEPRARTLRELRVAIWSDDSAAPIDQEIAARAVEVGRILQRNGAQVSTQARPELDMQASALSYVYLMQAVNNAGVPEPVYQQNLQAARSYGEDDTSMDAIFARAAVQSHREWLAHDNTRLRARLAWRAFFTEWDVLVCPISATVAFPHDHRPFNERTLTVNGAQRPYFESSFWAGMTSLPGLPSTVFPTGLSGDGLPIGLQAVAGEFEDRTAIEFARLIAAEIGGFETPPAYT